MSDPHGLSRFVAAQDPVIDDVLEELRRGRKTSHWMWFVFPQIAGLGRSGMAQRYAIASAAEASAYLGHEILGPRLHRCTSLVLEVQGRSVGEIFGQPDDMKFQSSMTLFAATAASPNLFEDALRRYFGGTPDAATLARL